MSSNFFKANAPRSLRDPQPNPTNLSHNELMSNQQAKVIPWFCSTRKLALEWISPIYNLRSKDFTGSVGAWGKAARLNPTDIGAKVGQVAKAPQTKRGYYGTIAGIACWGPVDALIAVMVNRGTVWPTHELWADGVANLQTVARKRTGGIAVLHFAVTHGLRKGAKFIVSGLDDASFDEASPTVITDSANTRILYANAGPNVALIPDVNGLITKVIHYDLNELRRDGASIWQCILA